jgi:hypothetical protein
MCLKAKFQTCGYATKWKNTVILKGSKNAANASCCAFAEVVLLWLTAQQAISTELTPNAGRRFEYEQYEGCSH